MTDLGRVLIADDDPARLRLALETTGGNRLKAASILEIDRSTLRRRLQQLQAAASLPLPS